MSAIQKKGYFCVLVIMVIAFFLRLLYFADYKETSVFPILEHSDGYSYYNWARDIESGQFVGDKAFMKWPLYAYILAFLLKLCSNNIALVYHIQFIFGVSHCLVIYFIGKKLFNRAIGFIAAMLCAVYGLFIFYEGLLIYTSFSLLLNAFLFLYLLHMRENPYGLQMFCLGVLLGLCVLAQGNVVVFGILAALFVVGGIRRHKPVVIFYSWFLSGLFIVLAFSFALNWLAEKDFVPVSGNLGINFYLGNNERASGSFPLFNSIGLNQESMFTDAGIIASKGLGHKARTSEVSWFWLKKGLVFARLHPLDFFRLLAKKLLYALAPNEFIHDIEFSFIKEKIGIFKILPLTLWFVLPFTFIGFISGLSSWRKYFLLYIAVFSYAASIALFFITARYRMTVVPWYMVFAAYGMYILYCKLRLKRYVQAIIMFFGGLGLSFGLGLFVNFTGPSTQEAQFQRYLYAAIYWEHNGDYKKSLHNIKKAAIIHSDSQYVLFRHGVLCYRMQDFACAEAYFKKVIEQNPLQVDAYYNLGVLYNKRGNYAAARQMLFAALELNPENPRTLFELGYMYQQTGQADKAVEAFNRSLQALPVWRKAQRLQVEAQLQALK